MPIQCIVHGCTNKNFEGNFKNDICTPCYKMIVEGKVGHSTNFIASLFDENKKTKANIRQIIKEYEERIEDCDIILNKIKEGKAAIRKKDGFLSFHDKNTIFKLTEDYTELSKDWKHHAAQRQCYVQFISDLKSELLGEI